MAWCLVKLRDNFNFSIIIIIIVVVVVGAVIAQSVYRWATDWTIGVLRFDSRRGLVIFPFTAASRTALGPTLPPIQRVSEALSLREADQSPPYSADVKE
jgi:hypothetical protein